MAGRKVVPPDHGIYGSDKDGVREKDWFPARCKAYIFARDSDHLSYFELYGFAQGGAGRECVDLVRA